MSACSVLLVPGLGDSGPEHWQSSWQKRFGYARLDQRNWTQPALADWVAALDQKLRYETKPLLLVAHSLGCALVAHWAAGHDARGVAGALLVAPADVDSELHTPPEVRGFAPMPLHRLPFRAIVVASRTDPYVTFERAAQFADAWGASLVDAGPRGHLNADSDLGEWPEGQRLLARLEA